MVNVKASKARYLPAAMNVVFVMVGTVVVDDQYEMLDVEATSSDRSRNLRQTGIALGNADARKDDQRIVYEPKYQIFRL